MRRIPFFVACAFFTFGLGTVGVWLFTHRHHTRSRVAAIPVVASHGPKPLSASKLRKVGDVPALIGEEGIVSLQFVDAAHGWLSIDGKLWRSDDSGASWNQVRFPWMEKRYNDYEYSLGGFQFLNAMEGWLIADNQLYRTGDGGDSWNFVNQPFRQLFPSDSDPEGLSGFAFLNDGQHGWITGERFRPLTPEEREGFKLDHEKYSSNGKQVLGSFIYFTSNGGRTWTLRPVEREKNIFYNARYSLSAIDNQHALALGMDGVYRHQDGRWVQARPAKRTDGADSVANCLAAQWGALATYPSATFFLNSDVGWLANTNGLLGKTLDGGKTWTDIFDGFDYDIADIGASRWGKKIYFIDTKRGWGLDGDGSLLASTDGGESWKRVDGDRFQELFILDEHHGWAVSTEGIFSVR